MGAASSTTAQKKNPAAAVRASDKVMTQMDIH